VQAVAAPPAAIAPTAVDTVRHVVLLGGRAAGLQRSWTAPDGARWFAFQYVDRGRGPDLAERVVLDARGLPRAIAVDGVDYVKRAVHERFDRVGRAVTWASGWDRGRREVPPGAFYQSTNGAPGETALLARALLASPTHRLAMLPSGEASIERIGERAIAADGRTRVVVQYALSGLDFAPQVVWLDRDGALFARGSGAFMIIREGWESVASTLLEAQTADAARRSEAVARRAVRQTRRALVLRDASLFDAATARVLPHRTIVVVGDRISAIGEGAGVDVPAGAEVIDVGGRTVLPGLWDMHAHIKPADAPMYLAAGITSVRDLGGGPPEALQLLRRRIADGATAGPRIVMSGMIDGPGPFAGPTPVIVADEAARATTRQATRRSRCTARSPPRSYRRSSTRPTGAGSASAATCRRS
jgi:hypothetical protein